MASSVATPLQLLVLLAAVDVALFVRWIFPSLVMLVVAVVATFVLLRRDGATADHAMEAFKSRAFQPLQAMVFSVTVTAILWCAAWLDRSIGSSGAITGLVVAGFADAHSAVVGAASLVHSGGLGEIAGALAVLGALGTNTLAKLIVAAVTGGRHYVYRLAPGLTLMWLAAAAALTLSLSLSRGTP
jgi:uncharacterized membrane protein (DUF4010 family)